MRTVVVPPLFDLTLRPVVEAGDRLVDLNTHFVERLTAPEEVRALASRVPAEEALFVSAAASVLRRPPSFGWLRAAGLALRCAAAGDPGLRLAGDDVELVGGSTESSAEVLAAARATRLFDREAELAAAIGEEIHLVVETDQQLPAAVRIVDAVGARNVVLCGRFAEEHRVVLSEVLPGVRTGSGAPRWRLADAWAAGDVRFVKRPADWTPGDAWIGWLAPRDVLALPAEAWSTCAGLTVTAARVRGDELVDVHGDTVDLGDFLGADGVPERAPAIELLVGAPGVGTAETRETAFRLQETGRLAGLSPFRLPAGAAPSWAGTPLDLIGTPGHDLPRWSRFAVPPAGPAELNAELSGRADLYPGRFAACCLPRASHEGDWDPSAAVVDSSVVNLRTGRAFRVHPKLAPVLERLSDGDASALTRLPEAGRVKLADQLVRTGALRRSA